VEFRNVDEEGYRSKGESFYGNPKTIKTDVYIVRRVTTSTSMVLLRK
jgi:hypothetical protein